MTLKNFDVLDALRDGLKIKLAECVKYLYQEPISVLEIERDKRRRIVSSRRSYIDVILFQRSEDRLLSTRLCF